MPADALSDVLRAFRLTGSMFFRAQLRAPFAITAMGVEQLIEEYAPGVQQLIPFHLVTEGSIWFEVEGQAEPLRLEHGDIIVLPGGAIHHLTDAPGSTPSPAEVLADRVRGDPPTAQWGGQGATSEALCRFFQYNSRLFNPLLRALPPVLVVRNDSERAPWITATLQRAFTETNDHRVGRAAMVGRLTELLFLEVVQRYLEEGDASGWLGALNDPIVSTALATLHTAPDRPWTLDALAREAGTSRSTLAERFSERLGTSPMRYLMEWRIELAAQRLQETDDSVLAVANAFGYDSEAAFNRAFKRLTGQPPAAWRRAQRAIHATR